MRDRPGSPLTDHCPLPTAHCQLDPAPSRGAGRRGFSLVEILVATAILMVIVMMMSMVFQQTSGAFQSGTRRVQSQTALRNILGVIARDLTLAVDSADYPGVDNMFISPNNDRVGFVALTGTSDKRMLQWIEFKYENQAVRRSSGDLIWDPAQKKWKIPSPNWVSLNPDDPLKAFFFVPVFPPDVPTFKAFPLQIGVQGALQTKGGASLASGQSAGKDKKFGTEDDIYVGAGENVK